MVKIRFRLFYEEKENPTAIKLGEGWGVKAIMVRRLRKKASFFAASLSLSYWVLNK